jgi:glycosyltransferase involved in cell wall biosynthesis
MAGSLGATVGFLAHLLRDIVGTLRESWLRFYRRVVLGAEEAAIGVDIFPFFERMTGVGWYEWNLLAALDRRTDGLRYNLYAHTFLAPDEPAPPEMPGDTAVRFRIHQLPRGFLLPVRPTLLLLRGLVEPLLRVLDDNDVLFAPNFFMQPSQLPFGRTAVATVHDLAFAVMPGVVASTTLRELRQHLPLTLYRAERLIAVSDATAQDLVEFLGVSRRRIHTVHEGLDPSFSTPAGALSEERRVALPDPYVLFVSTLEPRKNVVNILRAFRLLVEWGYPGHLLLVGHWGWKTGDIRRELDSSPVGDRIEHIDYVAREALPRLYSEADVLLFPSLLEGFGLPLLEAMACGTPVVTSGLSAMPEVAGPAACYADPASPHSIASAAAAVINDPQHRDRLAELGRKRARHFSWDLAAAATAQALRQAAGLPRTADDEYRVT